MKTLFERFLLAVFMTVCIVSCGPDIEPEEKPDPVVPAPDPEPGPEPDPEPDPEPTPVPAYNGIRVDGRNLVDEAGNVVVLHGFGQTYSPFFNNNAWSNYDVAGCLHHNHS